jgi:hypothetical protein
MNGITGDTNDGIPDAGISGGGGGSVNLSKYLDIDDPAQTVVDTIPVFKTSGQKRLKLTSVKATELDARITTNTTALNSLTTTVYNGTDVSNTSKAARTVYGPTSTYTSASALASGVPVTTDNVAGTLRIKLMTTTWETCVGFTVTSATAAGQLVTVATTGAICVVQKQTVSATPVVYELTAGSSAVVQTNKYVRFTDSGGLPNDYSSNENYSVVFDAGLGGEWGVLANDWEMEVSGTNNSLYDRLGLQVADLPSGPWVNASIPNWWTTTTTTAPWVSTRDTYGPGWILTGTPSKFETLSDPGYTHASRTRVTISGKRYIKFTFFSDGSGNNFGWDIDLLSSQFNAVGLPLFLDTSVSGNVAEGGSGPVLASVVGTDDTNNLVYARVA